MEGGAYGAGRAGAPFDAVAYIKKPQVIVRLLSLVFAIVVFGCIASRGYYNISDGKSECLFQSASACSYGIGIGVLAFLICIAFLVLDALFDQLSGVQQRKYAVIADMAVSSLWCFLWFVGFCFLTDSWRKSKKVEPQHFGVNDVQASIAFSFFSFISWAVLVGLAVMRYRKGVTEEFGTSGDDTPRPDIAQSSNPYTSFGGETDQSYQQQPYQQPPYTGGGGGVTEKSQAPGYQQPTY